MNVLTGLKTHITAAVGIVVALLVASGVITHESEQEMTAGIIRSIELIGSLILAFQSLYAIFMRIAVKKETEKVTDAAVAAAAPRVYSRDV